MRKLMFVVLLLLAPQAHAADFGVAPVLPASVSWTGWFAGLNGGAGFSTDDANALTSTRTHFDCCGGFSYSASNTASNGALNTSANGWFFGGQGGYNYQMGSLILGGIVDIDWSNLKGSDTQAFNTTPAFFVPFGPGFNVGLPTSVGVASRWGWDWLMTYRARAGMTVLNADTLVYLTGGGALAQISGQNLVSATSANLISGLVPGATGTAVDNFDETKWGWTIGAGIESRLTPRLSWFVEYLYVDLGSRDVSVPVNAVVHVGPGFLCPGPCPTVTTNASARIHQDFTASLARFGINYKFN